MAEWLVYRGVEDLKNIHECAKPFSKVDLKVTYSIAQADSIFTTQDREVPKLGKESVPKVLLNCPSYLSSIIVSSNRYIKVPSIKIDSLWLSTNVWNKNALRKVNFTYRPSNTCKIQRIDDIFHF